MNELEEKKSILSEHFGIDYSEGSDTIVEVECSKEPQEWNTGFGVISDQGTEVIKVKDEQTNFCNK